MGIMRYPARVLDPIAHDLTVESAEIGVIGGLVIAATIAGVVIVTVLTAGGDLPVLSLVAGVAGGGAGGGTLTSMVYGFTDQPKDKIKGHVEEGSGDTQIENRRAARVGDECICQDHGHEEKIRTGCREVLVNLRPLARVLDETDHEALITDGAHSVLVGGTTYSSGEFKSALEGTGVQDLIDALALTSALAEGGELVDATAFVASEFDKEGARALENPEVRKALSVMRKKGYNVGSYAAEKISAKEAGEDAFITKVLRLSSGVNDAKSPAGTLHEGAEILEHLKGH